MPRWGGVVRLDRISKVTLSSITSAVVLSAVFFTTSLVPQNASAANTAKLDVGVTVLPTCNVSADITDHSSEFSPGTYKAIGGETTFTVSCNSSDGWSIYAVGNSGSDGTEGNTNLIGSSSNIATGTATEGTTSNWSFKLSSPSSGLTIASGYNANSAVPATRTKVISRESGTTAANTGDTFKASYSAYISSTQAPDTYKGSVKYILFHPATVATRTMQDFSCASLQKGQLTTLIDSRDNNPYEVAKLQDDKCWMVENLRLGGSAPITLHAADSNVTKDFQLPASSLNDFVQSKHEAVYVDSTYSGFYTWFVATAGTGESVVTEGANATGFICPKGWRLPTGGKNDSDFGRLVAAYGGDNKTGNAALTNAPIPGFSRSGYIWHGGDRGMEKQDNDGDYWPSTAVNNEQGYNFFLSADGSRAQFNANAYKINGHSVRCVTG